MRKRHFTLIELLIVIAIIAILMTIALAVGGAMMAKAENNACASMVQKVLAACEKFKTDFGSYPGELNSSGGRDTARQQPRYGKPANNNADVANDLGRYLFKRIPGENSDQGSSSRANPTTWHGDYLDESDVSEVYIDKSTNAEGNKVYTILDYWQTSGRPLMYWLRYKNGAASTDVTSDKKKKLTPEIWSLGGDAYCGPDTNRDTSCIKLVRYPDLKKCTSSHAYDEDNVGGDINTVKH